MPKFTLTPAQDGALKEALRLPHTTDRGREAIKSLRALGAPDGSFRTVAKHYEISLAKLYRAVRVYREGGVGAVAKLAHTVGRPKYDAATKARVLALAKLSPALSIPVIAQATQVSYGTVVAWVRPLQRPDPRAGRPSTKRPAPKFVPTDARVVELEAKVQVTQEQNERLAAELASLRALVEQRLEQKAS